MTRRRTAQQQLRPAYVRPTFDARERAALRDWRVAAYTGDRLRPKPGAYDPLWLRLGMRCCQVQNRAGWVVSSPQYSDLLDRRPDLDPSQPGPGWLREVYRWRDRDLVTLPGVRALIEQRLQASREAEPRTSCATAYVQPPPAPPRLQQQDLFHTEPMEHAQ